MGVEKQIKRMEISLAMGNLLAAGDNPMGLYTRQQSFCLSESCLRMMKCFRRKFVPCMREGRTKGRAEQQVILRAMANSTVMLGSQA